MKNKEKTVSANKKVYDVKLFVRLIETMDIEAILKDIEPAIIRYSKRTNLDFDEVLQNSRIVIWTVIESGKIKLNATVENGVMKKGINPRNYLIYACINGIRDMLRLKKRDNKLIDAIKDRSSEFLKNKIYRDTHGELSEKTEWNDSWEKEMRDYD